MRGVPQAEQPAPIDRHPTGQPHPEVPVAIGVTGVPEIAVEEALWLAAGVLHEA